MDRATCLAPRFRAIERHGGGRKKYGVESIPLTTRCAGTCLSGWRTRIQWSTRARHNVGENTDKNFSSGIHTWTPIVSSCSKVKDITRRATSYRRSDTGRTLSPRSPWNLTLLEFAIIWTWLYIRLSHLREPAAPFSLPRFDNAFPFCFRD